ncbi:hypothetical protein BX667DRAFT_495458 [Coemansia mojavensis]|nr:hypothetical protein BX667DRAFT_495458 [Coemansia mojavensis]
MSPSPENKPDYLKIGEIILLVVVVGLSIGSSIANWSYRNTHESPFDNGMLKGFDFAPRVLLGVSGLLALSAVFMFPVTKETPRRLKTARAALFAAYSILAACTAMLDPMVPIALASSDNNSIIVKGVSIACMSLAAVFMIYTIVHVSRKR